MSLEPATAVSGVNPVRMKSEVPEDLRLEPGRLWRYNYLGDADLVDRLERTGEPVAVTSGDFDADGIDDLVVSYSMNGGAAVAIYRGNPDAIYPLSAAAIERRKSLSVDESPAPFLADVRVYPIPSTADFLATGDFDNDGHRDLVGLQQGAAHLWWSRGNGDGELEDPKPRPLGAPVTAAAAGEVGTYDGLIDLVVAVYGDGGPQLTVFSGPQGVLQAESRQIPLPAPAQDLAIAPLGERGFRDVAVAAGKSLLLVHSRSFIGDKGGEPAIEASALPFEPVDIAVGDFMPDERGRFRLELALLSPEGEVWGLRFPDTRYADQAEYSGPVLRPIARVPAPISARAQLLPAHVSVISGQELLNVDPGRTELTIAHTARPGKGGESTVETRLKSAAPPIAAHAMRLDPDGFSDLVLLQSGTVEPVVLRSKGAAVTHVVNINSGANSLTDVNVGDGSCDVDEKASGLQCNLRAAIQEVNASGGNISFDLGPGVHVYAVRRLDDIMVPSTVLAPDPASGTGIILTRFDNTSDTVLNFTGGNAAVQNLMFDDFALSVRDTSTYLVEGIRMGTDETGTNATTGRGVSAVFASNVTIGGLSEAARCVISGGGGVNIFGSSLVTVQGNRIGTDLPGKAAISNVGDGVAISGDSTDILIGGTEENAGNIIAANDGDGISLFEGGMTVQQNLIGLNIDGEALENMEAGVSFFAETMLIGGTAARAQNVIGSNAVGVSGGAVFGAAQGDVKIQGNKIGTDPTGTEARSNDAAGVLLSSRVTVGGTGPGEGNLISGNLSHGIELPNQSTAVIMQGNLIGTQADGVSPLRNEGHGILIDFLSTGNLVGGVDSSGNPEGSNVIAFNLLSGVSIEPSSTSGGPDNTILGNSIHSNEVLGIDLGGDGPTPNDDGDADEGPNNIQNFPIISMVDANGHVDGSLNSLPNETFRIEFFSADDCGDQAPQGRTFLDAIDVPTDGSGNAAISHDLPAPPAGIVTATATLLAGGVDPTDTSEFSPCSRLVVNSTADSPDGANGDGVCDTGGTILRGGNPEPECTLRAAIEAANDIPGTDTVAFDVPDTTLPVFTPGSPLPNITEAVIIDASGQPGDGFAEIDLSSAGGFDGLRISSTANGTTLKRLAVYGLGSGTGIRIDGADDVVIEECRVGTDTADGADMGNGLGIVVRDSARSTLILNVLSGNKSDGLTIDGTSSDTQVIQNHIGTSNAGDVALGNASGIQIEDDAASTLIADNVISGNRDGIFIGGNASDVTIQLNRIGVDDNGLVAVPNTASGIQVFGASNVTIGGTGVNTENIISGNRGFGIFIQPGFSNPASQVTIHGNRIGTDATGAVAIGNGLPGIFVDDGSMVTIGGAQAGAGNLISGNDSDGIQVTGSNTSSVVVAGNRIGTDDDGSSVVPNAGNGITLFDALDVTIGGSTAAEGNLISGNLGNGVHIEATAAQKDVVKGGANPNAIASNLIGTNVDGTAALGNQNHGVNIVEASNNNIGGPNPGEGNLISGNAGHGIRLFGPGATGNFIEGNLIGTDAAGMSALGNTMAGVLIDGAPGNAIGSVSAVEPNVISGNQSDGIVIQGVDAAGNEVTANLIGSAVDGFSALGNGGDGISVSDEADFTSIAANRIAFNTGAGVTVSNATGQAIVSNRISSNGGLGIDIGPAGVNVNDDRDPDTGANFGQNYPIIDSVVQVGPDLTITGSLNSIPESNFDIEIFGNANCDPSGFGEGAMPLEIVSVTTNSDGNASFETTVPEANAAVVTATATDDSANTSEFSACADATVDDDLVFANGFEGVATR